ncbi:MAG: sugar phosphate isomerase/epimerase [Candidatus Omnitrophica bacterium]|nr:sugar phosphate isomerase/epimerase [Candidatus Omnitrophota bacterium]
MSFALSTSWNALRYENAKDMLFEIKGLGFEKVELGFNLTVSMVEAIERIQKEQDINVISLHNFCPIPPRLKRDIALPDYYAMSSFDEEERRLAVKYTQVTIDLAARLGAKAVVLHCGRVQIPDKTRILIQLYETGQKETKEFKAIKTAMQKERADNYKPFFKNSLRSLDQLNRYAQKKGVYLGIETRFYYHEIPSFEEIGIILNEFKGANLFYWHDTGHAQVMENLGFCRHEEYLNLYGPQMLGMHLHDISGGRDHQPPGKGKLDFCALKKYIGKNVLKILEIHHPATAHDIKEAKEYLAGILDG